MISSAQPAQDPLSQRLAGISIAATTVEDHCVKKGGTLILVQGLAGSGKSHLIEMLAGEFKVEEGFAVDPSEERKNIKELADALSTGQQCVVSERKYRTAAAREIFFNEVKRLVGQASSEPRIVTFSFENDLDAANNNCTLRSNKPDDPDGIAHIRQNDEDSRDYEIPDDAIRLMIHRISNA